MDKGKRHPAAIDPSKLIAYTHKQSHLPQLDSMLPARLVMSGKSQSGKGGLLQQLILHHFRGAFERYYIWSPTCFTDVSTWGPVREYIKNETSQNMEKEPAFFDTFDEAKLESLIKRHSDVVKKQKDAAQGKSVRLFGCLHIFDDMADDSSVMKRSSNSILNRLYLSGRHHGISTWCSVQKLSLVSVPIRVNATGAMLFKCTQHEFDSIDRDYRPSSIDKQTFWDIFEEATSEPYSFLFIRLNAKRLEDMFMKRFEEHFSFLE